MARVLIVSDADRALLLARRLGEVGHPTRIVTADPTRRGEIEAAGAECWLGDPSRLGTITSALESVSVACWLLGDDDREELHHSRLQAFLGKTIDSTVRGLLYEAAGGAPSQLLSSGAEVAKEIAERNEIPLRVLHADPSDPQRWCAEAVDAVEALISRS